MSRTAKTFIDKVIRCEISTQADIITEELAAIRNRFINEDRSNFVEDIIKLMFLTVRGYNTAFCQVQLMSLFSNPHFSFKRIAYLAASIIIDEGGELAVMLTQEVQKDLKSNDRHIVLIALQYIANAGETTLCQTVSGDILNLLDSQDPLILKAAIMAAVHTIRLLPDTAESFKPFVGKLVLHQEHGISIAGINLAMAIYHKDPSSKEKWVQLVPQIVKNLRGLVSQLSSSEYIHVGINDPFLKIKLLDFLGIIGEKSGEVDELLTKYITSLSTGNQKGISILQSAIDAASNCAQKDTLRALGINEIGKKLSTNSNSTIYSALSCLSRLLFRNKIFNRESADAVAIQRYQESIILLLDNPDNSIRRRALDVICALVNHDNAAEIIPKMSGYLKSVDLDFRLEMVPKVLSAIQEFAPNVMWNFDQQLDLLLKSGSVFPTSSLSTFTNLVLANQEIQPHAISVLSNALIAYPENQTLIQAASFVIGELQNDSSMNDIQTLYTLTKVHHSNEETLGYILIALAKLGVRLNERQRVCQILDEVIHSNSVDTQQRCGELSRILRRQDLTPLLDPLPVESPESTEQSASSAQTTSPNTSLNGIDLLLNTSPSSPSPSPSQEGTAKSPAAQKVEVKQDSITPPKNSVEAARTQDYVVYFEIAPVKGLPRLMVRSTTFGLGSKALHNFKMQFGVPAGWSVATQNPSSDVLDPIGGKPIVQLVCLEMRTKVKLVVKGLVQYLYGSQPLQDTITFNNIFEKFGV
ncbi:Adaptin N terminal region family protein [Trichomonas vaginalis G3]|uniref:Adaptin N terminal region family protein n=1 Tax=Trichomonas vaginalis (strain ATCC PRA-98 / G3) TaxID=412133 RepID=A2DKZ4_TRIV3|nr:adaptin, alpha/gamma/epsilon family [Trichomonas vaginalis G3]EAY18947.1 Adaptin N terminal region family protein [Trichomonas vaginalis G3]KAI5532013.1 adaptin, alpha/gamma/epsilon family [Trichomonas vaginalis G3]|eukprot:XP_001579933.1 Adaptin N terminal region family protein [Trichomonas vaginalis G3]